MMDRGLPWVLASAALLMAGGASGTTPTVTFTLPTGTETFTSSESHTSSETHTSSLTLTRESSNNYTMDLQPAWFYAGQEFRIRIEAVLEQSPAAAEQNKKMFNASDMGTLEVRLYAWSASIGAECSAYSSSPLATENEFGMTVAASAAGERFVAAAHMTLIAPAGSTKFVICFKHTMDERYFNLERNGEWQAFARSSDGRDVFEAADSKVWYHIPDATVGQYAIVQLLSEEDGWNFTYAPSTCATTWADCGKGDNLKIVPAGAPCTYEYQNFGSDYFGSTQVQADGTWATAALDGMREGATAGGVGVFGTQYANPLVDAWTAAGTYYPANTENFQHADVVVDPVGGETRHAYAYVRLPATTGSYDVCFSSLEQRISLRTGHTILESIPVWRKLYRCTSASACATNSAAKEFTTAAEPMGWSMVDLSPNTWGEIVFDDSSETQLNSEAATSTVIVSAPVATVAYPYTSTATANYWAPAGGDHFKIVSSAYFAEETTASRVAPYSTGAQLGSRPSAGCWSRALDTASSSASPAEHGGMVDDGARYPIGSRDLTGDPTDSTASHDASGVAATFATLYVPNHMTRWHVCYRRTCTFSGATCPKYSGYRVLAFHTSTKGTVPAKWVHLEAKYAHDELVPATWGGEEMDFGPSTTWFMNDTRIGTWGPLIVEQTNATEGGGLDSRAWNLVRTYATGDTVTATIGSTLRLVKWDRPCDYPGFDGHDETMAAMQTDGGMVECNSMDAHAKPATGSEAAAGWNCEGSSSDLASVSNVAFYITVPESANYRVCLRVKGWNWRELSPSSATGAWNDASHPMPSTSLERGEWTPPATYFSPTSSGLSHLTLTVAEDRAGMEATFLVEDTYGSLTAAPRGPCSGGCDNSGDVLRLVKASGSASCDVNPGNWDAGLADTHVSLHCAKTGSGAASTSSLVYDASAVVPCALAMPTVALCGGSSEYRCNSTNTRLAALVARTPDVYDDIVPHDVTYYNHKTVAAVVALPAYSSGGVADNQYKICYKQFGTSNWVIFNDTYEVQPSAGFSISEPAVRSVKLVGGELRQFQLSLSSGKFPVNAAGTEISGLTLFAKLVMQTAENNDNCLNEPAGTEAQPLGAGTTAFSLVADNANTSLTFAMVVPQAAGMYHLCVQVRYSAEDSLSWWRAGGESSYAYEVLDNGLRWYVSAGHQPTNQGLSVVKLVKCTASAGTCATAGNTETFNTTAGGDAAKIVATTSACSDGSGWKAGAGASEHVGQEGGSAAGRTNLGPAEGPADVAELKVTLPAVASDAQVYYKVCVLTSWNLGTIGGTGQRWVEVAQARGLQGQLLVTGAAGEPSFYTAQALMKSWTLASALMPAKSLLTGPPADTVALGGASTQYVSNPTASSTTSAATAATGFHFNSHANLVAETKTENEFKLVAVSKPAGRVPEDPAGAEWGTTANWKQVGEEPADCMGPAVDSASNLGSCADEDDASGSGVCPQLEAVGSSTTTTERKALFHVPMDSGEYAVCYRVKHSTLSAARPWLLLPSATNTHYSLYSHPSYLEVEVNSAGTNATAFDLRVADVADGLQLEASTWCDASAAGAAAGTDAGAPCGAQNNGGFTSDLLTIVNDTQVCPAPPLAPAGSSTGAPQWFRLLRTSNATAAVWMTWDAATEAAKAFALPVAAFPSASGQYKVCAYKAGDGAAAHFGNVSTEYVAKQGVTYQLYNRGGAASGGGSGYWRDTAGSGAAAKLLATSDLEYNSTLRFTEYSSTLEALYGPSVVAAELVTDEATGKVSRTPLLRSGTTVAFTVQKATADGFVLPDGSEEVVVMRCAAASGTAAWSTGLGCAAGLQTAPETWPGDFLVENVGAACSPGAGPRYGWPANGLRQFLVDGATTFNLQYRSACPGGGEFGCGVRFVTGSGAYSSAAQWVNVDEHAPDAVALDGVEADAVTRATSGCSATSKTCFQKACVHGKPCQVVIQARWNGPSEFAPNGTLAVHYARHDYSGWTANTVPSAAAALFGTTVSSTAPVVSAASWELGGRYTLSFTPRLQDTTTAGMLYLNVTYGDAPSATAGWTRFVVSVTKATPAAVTVAKVRPVDVERKMVAGRVPAPAFVPSSSTSSSVLTAAAGSYLEALVPYELTYAPVDASGAALPAVHGAMKGWTVSGKVTESGNSKVLADWTDSYTTEPKKLLAAVLSNQAIGTDYSFKLRFKVYVVDNACSRFASAGGCTLSFDFTHTPAGATTATTLSATMVTPVRVPAATVMVSPSTTRSTVREGILVRVFPGTYVVSTSNVEMFVYDEFHYGDVFALANGPGPTDGTATRDGTMLQEDSGSRTGCAFAKTGSTPSGYNCAVAKYGTKQLSLTAGTYWGAEWTMRPSVPCNLCEFTFHTTLGAGPQSHYLNSDGSQRGVKTLTWTQETTELQCSDATATFTVGAAKSSEFSVAVTAGVAGQSSGTNAWYPQWWVFTNTSADVTHVSGSSTPLGSIYALMQSGAPASSTLLTAKMAHGTASFSKLYFAGSAVPEAGVAEELTISFSTVAILYDTTVSPDAGSRPTGTAAISCTSAVSMTREEASEPRTSIELDSVTGATSLCGSSSSSCSRYTATVTEFLSSGLTVKVKFVNTSSSGTVTTDSATSRNVTIVPVGGPSTSPFNSAPSWTYDSATSTYVSGDVVLDSSYNGATADTLGSHTYSFGSLAVLATRQRPVASVESNVLDGAGAVKIAFGKTSATATVDNSPVRAASFKVCESAWDAASESEVTGTLCLTLELWVTEPSPTYKAVVWSEPSAGSRTRGTSASCGLSPTLDSLSVATYYSAAGVASATARFYAYALPVEYTAKVAAGTQYFTASGSAAASASLSAKNAVASYSGTSLLTHSLSAASLRVTFSYYGRDVLATATPMQVTAKDASTSSTTAAASIAGVTTTNTYTWADGTETFASWEHSAAVSLDDECPTKRYLQSTTSGYRTYASGAPGAGWNYSHAGSAAAGLPFPLQTVVKTTAGARAWSFTDGILMKVSKNSWSGCNDGGALAVYELKPSSASGSSEVRMGSLATSFALGADAGAAVATKRGVGLAWAVLGAECEACTLQLDLCFSGNAAAECLSGYGSGSADPSDATPLLADRTKVTKPFAVRGAAPDLVNVHAQTLPSSSGWASDGRSAIQVGAVFQVEVENVMVFGDSTQWAMQADQAASGWRRTAMVRSQWTRSTSEAVSMAEMRYGNGGFMVDGAARAASSSSVAACVVEDSEFLASAVTMSPWLTGASAGSLSFFFARPCSRCQVVVDYWLTKGSETRMGSIALRSYATASATGLTSVGSSALEFMVTACSEKWMLSGSPATAVRRRRPFAVTAVRTDRNGMPSWEGTTTAVLNLAASSGNGGGGNAHVTSPSAAGSTKAADGSATVRLYATRACYQCSVSFAGKDHQMTVVTDATQIVLAPKGGDLKRLQMLSAAGDKAAWTFDVYAADDLGDRAYTAGGPTEFAMQPRYSTYNSGGGARVAKTLSLVASGATTKSVVMSDPVYTLGSLSTGAPTTMKVANGTRVHNGVPVPALNSEAGETGTASVEFSGTVPGVDVPLTMALSGASQVSTNYFGEKKAATVSWTVAATRMAVDDAESASASSYACASSGLTQGMGWCGFTAWAIGRSPAATDSDTAWYVAVGEVAGTVAASVSCGTCGTAEVVPAEAAFAPGHGKADFRVKLLSLADASTACACEVTVTPPSGLANATAQAFSVTWEPTTLSVWNWGSTDTIAAASGSSAYTARSVVNRTVELGLLAMDSTETYSGLGGLTWSSASVVFAESSVDPAGCFKCASSFTTTDGDTACPVTAGGNSGDQVTITGVFTTAGTCSISSSAFSGFPTAVADTTASPLTGLTVTVDEAASVAVVPSTEGTNLETLTNFSGLKGWTLAGMPAAISGHGAWIRLKVVDAAGDVVTGDSHMEFTLTGKRVVDPMSPSPSPAENMTDAHEWGPVTATASHGYVTFMLDVNDTTRTLACEHAMMSDIARGTPCEHMPWMFNVSAAAPVSSDAVTTQPTAMGSVTNIGPLYFVRKAHEPMVFGSFGAKVPPECAAGSPDMPTDMPTEGNNASMPGVKCPPMPDMTNPKLGWATPLMMQGWKPVAGLMGAGGAAPASSWGYGFVFDLALFAVDKHGFVVRHPEDVGSFANAVMRPFAVPCLNVDQSVVNGNQWVMSTCIDNGGACETTRTMSSLTQCTHKASPWSVPSLEVEFEMGMSKISPVVYGGKGSLGGRKRFMLTTAEFSYDADVMGMMENAAHTFEIHMVDTAAVVPWHSKEEGKMTKCTFMSTGAMCMAEGFAVEPLTTFNLTMALTDMEMMINVADSTSNVSVTGACADNTKTSLAMLDASGELDFIKKPVFHSHRGVVMIDGLQISGVCKAFTLTVKCASGPTDTLKRCHGKTTTFGPFMVAYEDVNKTVPPAPVPKPITAALELASFDTPAAAKAFIDGIVASDFQDRMVATLKAQGFGVVDAVTLTYLCSIASGAAITAADKLDSSVCKDYLATPTPTTGAPDTNATDGNSTTQTRSFFALAGTALVAKAEFEVTTVVAVSAEAASLAVVTGIQNDLNDPNSVLKAGGGSTFSSANATSLTAGVASTPIPSSPAPPTTVPDTQAPPTEAPPTTVAPPTQTPPETTEIPVIGTVPLEMGAMASPCTFLTAVASAVAVMMLL
ncbi:hypothetical protein DIPPA_00634 [Diplonema papillatum]|nr:hypothetical protein DIPPA_00634 [Diplonema papillatum]